MFYNCIENIKSKKVGMVKKKIKPYKLHKKILAQDRN